MKKLTLVSAIVNRRRYSAFVMLAPGEKVSESEFFQAIGWYTSPFWRGITVTWGG